MSKRTERRAAERVARKTAFQELREPPAQSAPEAVAPPAPPAEEDLLARAQAFFNAAPESAAGPAVSEAQLVANRANAQLSTGPKTPEGRARSSVNSLKHGFTSKTVVLDGDEETEYNRQLGSYIETYKPVGHEEHRIVKSILDCHWRLNRIVKMETAIFFKGSNEFDGKFEEFTPGRREGLILAEVYLKYERQLRNLHIQEARLRRSREKDSAELQCLQTSRRREERLALEEASQPLPLRKAQPSSTPASKNGFVFSNPAEPSQNSHELLSCNLPR